MIGQEIINKTTHTIPNSPGVYRMIGKNNSKKKTTELWKKERS